VTQRSRFRPEPRCSQCGNEEDLDAWPTGDVICKHCLECPHVDAEHVNDVCTLCLRLLHTLWTFAGPRIRDLKTYTTDAMTEYVIRSFELLYWTFEEQEQAMADVGKEPLLCGHESVKRLPPHLRR
jgi:hypothetical protein